MTGRVKVLPGYRLAAVVADVSGITKIKNTLTMNSQVIEADLEKIGLVSE